MLRKASISSVSWLLVLGVLGACTNNTNKMVVERYDGNTGQYEAKHYSGFYIAYGWLDEGKLGFELWMDHDKKVVPLMRSDDTKATGTLTLYMVNLEQSAKTATFTSVRTASNVLATNLPNSLQIQPRSHTAIKLGSIPILNYGRQTDVVIEFSVDGVRHEKHLELKRLTETEMELYSGRSGLPPYPWFKPPYHPFKPPLAQQY